MRARYPGTCLTSRSSRCTKIKATAAIATTISLLSTVGKAFERVVFNHLQQLTDRVYPESQCGFQAKRSIIDMVFSIRQIQEKYCEQRRPLYLAFIDLTKAFDLVSRTRLFTLLPRIGCPKTPTDDHVISRWHDGHSTL
jgi:hypothetical protein